MAKSFYKGPPAGEEVRGFEIRLYPDQQTEELLYILQDDQRRAWNWLVKQTEEVLEARQAYALLKKLVPERPKYPDYNGLTPEQSKTTKVKFQEESREWHRLVYEATNKVPDCSYRKFKDQIIYYGFEHNYQLLGRVIDWGYEDGAIRLIEPCSLLLMALAKNYFSTSKNQRRKKFRRKSSDMPLQVRSGKCFIEGNFGDRRGQPFYDCQVMINGLKIKGRLPGRSPTGRILEGVSLRKEPDGWYASIKQEVPIRIPPPAVVGSHIGIDVGLDAIVAFSDGRLIENPRGKELSQMIADKQAQELPVGRLHQKAARHTKHIIYNKIIKPLAEVETIKVEKLSSKIGQMGSSKVSVMRTVVSLLKERYSERVREVECAYTSQDCSQCGFRSKESWSYEHGKEGECPECGLQLDRDINAACNVDAKTPIP